MKEWIAELADLIFDKNAESLLLNYDSINAIDKKHRNDIIDNYIEINIGIEDK